MNESEFFEMILWAYGQILAFSLPVALTIAGCNIAFNLLLSAFSGGRLHFGGD